MSKEITWQAVYVDGKTLSQKNEDGTENKYTDIDRSRLTFFNLYEGTKLIFRLSLEDGRRLIYRRRVSANLYTGNIKQVVYLVGWQKTINGQNIQDIAYIFEDGHIELAGRWKGERTFTAPNLIKQESETITKKAFSIGAVLLPKKELTIDAILEGDESE